MQNVIRYKSWIVIFAILIPIVVFVIVFMAGGKNNFNVFTGDINCTYKTACLHEIGHAIDVNESIFPWNWTSQSIEFKNMIDKYIDDCERFRPTRADRYYCRRIVDFPGFANNPLEKASWTTVDLWLQGGWGGYLELYAASLAWADGVVDEMPRRFRQFYDQSMVDKIVISQNMKCYSISRDC